MENVTYYNFCKKIAEDYGIEFTEKIKTELNQFPIKNGKRKICSFSDAIIVDCNGNEHPYMLSQSVRNNEKLIEFDYLYIVRSKNLKQIIEETNVTLKQESCKVCEGGGWYSQGTKYTYEDTCCEV